ncbi:hypothetical protein SDC9_174872 [bioreactor metagenome]|uniref:Uncharacterized protein n=1 Tax=bioreactor metagenome TaxID=1076179 RepID=A0A645GNF8_9ZZZZ
MRGDYLAIYSPVDRTQVVFLKTPGSYRDWITGKTLGSGKRLAFEMKRGQTVVLENIAR